MCMSTAGSALGADFSKLGKGDYFMWHQFHAEDWGAHDFDVHGPVYL